MSKQPSAKVLSSISTPKRSKSSLELTFVGASLVQFAEIVLEPLINLVVQGLLFESFETGIYGVFEICRYHALYIVELRAHSLLHVFNVGAYCADFLADFTDVGEEVVKFDPDFCSIY